MLNRCNLGNGRKSIFFRISPDQEDRGQVVISTGPYQFVRHPGYSSSVVSYLVFPLALGTIWALIPGVLTIELIILLTALEDQMLQEDLPG